MSGRRLHRAGSLFRLRGELSTEQLHERIANAAILISTAKTGDQVDFDRVIHFAQRLQSARRRSDDQDSRTDADQENRLSLIDESPAQDLECLGRKSLLKHRGVFAKHASQDAD